MTTARQSLTSSSTDPNTRSVLAQIAALKTATTPVLKVQWRILFGSGPPLYNRKFLESRLTYKLQQLHYGGLKPETEQRLTALGEKLDAGKPQLRRVRQDELPIVGTRLIRQYHGIEHVVTVLPDGGFEYGGRPYRSLSAIARAVTGTRWNGWTFFGLKSQRGST